MCQYGLDLHLLSLPMLTKQNDPAAAEGVLNVPHFVTSAIQI